MKKVLKGKRLANVEQVKQETAEALKGIKIDEFKTGLSSGRNIPTDVLHQTESAWKVSEI